jgi:hypothetical protein
VIAPRPEEFIEEWAIQNTDYASHWKLFFVWRHFLTGYDKSRR